jgi:hypothetical protein
LNNRKRGKQGKKSAVKFIFETRPVKGKLTKGVPRLRSDEGFIAAEDH